MLPLFAVQSNGKDAFPLRSRRDRRGGKSCPACFLDRLCRLCRSGRFFPFAGELRSRPRFLFLAGGERIFCYSTDSTDTKLVKSLRRLVFKCVGGGREPTGLRHNRYGRLQETENSLAQKIPRISRRPFRQTTHILPSHCRIASLRLGEGNSTRWVNIS